MRKINGIFVHFCSLSERLAEARKNVNLIKKASGSVSRRVPLPDLSDAKVSVKAVTRERTDHGKKLSAIGTALIVLPEPVTSAAGVPLLMLGRAMSHSRGANLREVYSELNRSLRDIAGSI